MKALRKNIGKKVKVIGSKAALKKYTADYCFSKNGIIKRIAPCTDAYFVEVKGSTMQWIINAEHLKILNKK